MILMFEIYAFLFPIWKPSLEIVDFSLFLPPFAFSPSLSPLHSHPSLPHLNQPPLVCWDPPSWFNHVFIWFCSISSFMKPKFVASTYICKFEGWLPLCSHACNYINLLPPSWKNYLLETMINSLGGLMGTINMEIMYFVRLRDRYEVKWVVPYPQVTSMKLPTSWIWSLL